MFRPANSKLALLCACALCLAATDSSRAALIGDWRLDTDAGNVAVDSSGNGNHGTIINSPTLVPGLNSGNALDFSGSDGDNDYVTFGLFSPLNGATQFSAMAFARRDSNNGTGNDTNHLVRDVIMAHSGESGNDNFEIGYSANNVRVYLDTGSGSEDAQTQYDVPGGISNGVAHHVAIVYNGPGDDAQDITKTYFDGKLIGLDNRWRGATQAAGGNAELTLALARPDRANPWGDFDGVIDDVQFHDTAIRSSEVNAHFSGKALPIAALSYNASTDDINGIWEEEVQALDTGSRDYALTGQPSIIAGGNGNLGITRAYHFSGDGPVSTSDESPQGFGSDVTDNSASFELWFKPTDLQGQEVLWEWGGDTDGSSLTLDDNMVRFRAKDSGVTSEVLGDVTGLQGLIQAVGVVDLDSGLVSLFLNGQFAGSMAFGGADWAGSDPIRLGGQDGQIGGSLSTLVYGDFFGDIAIARFYAEALNLEEVQALYAENHFIPEPATLALLGLGAAGLLGRRRRAA